MKKLLATLAALGITASSATTVISCGDTKTVKDDTKKIVDELNKIESNEKTLLTLEADKPTNENITKTLLSLDSLRNFSSLSFEIVGTNSPTLSENKTYQDGSIVVKALSNNQEIGGKNFTFKFNTLDHLGTNQILTALNNGLELEIGNDLSISTPFGNTINTVLGAIIPMIKKFIPTNIPTKFNVTEKADPAYQDWSKWEKALNDIKELLSSDVVPSITIDGKTINIAKDPIIIDKQMTMPVMGTEATATVHLEIKVIDLIENIMPDIVHLRNFILDQEKTNSNDNLILLLIQYLLDTPQDINDDGFGSINQTIPAITDSDGNPTDENLVFNNNLEIFVHDLFEGWQNASQEMNTHIVKVDGKTTQKPDSEEPALKINLKSQIDMSGFPMSINWNLKYQTKTASDNPDEPQDISIFSLISEKDIIQDINIFLNYDLSNPSPINIDPLGISTDIPSDAIANAIKDSLKLFVKSGNSSLTNVEDSTLKWSEGMMKVEYLDKDSNEWIALDSIENLKIGKAIDLRIRFIDNKFTDDEGNNFSLDKDIILNLNISASAFE